MEEQVAWIAREPANPRPYRHLAEFYRMEGRQEEALGLMLHAVHLDPGFAAAHAADHQQVFTAVVGAQGAQEIEPALGCGVGGQSLGLGQAGDQLGRVDRVGVAVDETAAQRSARQRGGAVGPDAERLGSRVREEGNRRRAVAAGAMDYAGEAAQPGIDRADRELSGLCRRRAEADAREPRPRSLVALEIGMDTTQSL